MAMRIEELAGSLQMARTQRDDLQGVRAHMFFSRPLSSSPALLLFATHPLPRAIPPQFSLSLSPSVSPTRTFAGVHLCACSMSRV